MQDGVVEEGRGHERGGGGQLGVGAVERLPLALGLRHCPLLQLSQTAALLLDHLLAWGGGEGEDEEVLSTAGTSDPPQTSLILVSTAIDLPSRWDVGPRPPQRPSAMINGRREERR